jgi:uncharacterized protein
VVDLSSTSRIGELDALRGLAVGGIMLVNTWQHAPQADTFSGLDWTIEAFLQGRFYPIFSMLFGMSFVLFLQRAGRWLLLSRLFWLFLIGLVQHTWYEGEVLTHYAVWGAIVLLPASFLTSGWPVLAAGVAAVVWSVIFYSGGWLLIPGMFLVGMALMQLRPSRELLLPAFGVSAVAMVLLMAAAYSDQGSSQMKVFADLAAVAAYSTGLLLILRPWLSAVLEPMGRMALTNYVSGTIVIVLAQPFTSEDLSHWRVVGLAGVTIAVQAVFSRWWLSRFRYGPLEWVWRMLTRFQYVPNRLESGRDENRPLPDPGLT